MRRYGGVDKMRINSAGFNLIKMFEGLALKAYQDVVGIWTIGYGHTGSDVTDGMAISDSKAEQLLHSDVSRFETAVSRLVSVPLNSNEFSALVSLAFNIGDGNLASSTVLKRLNVEDRLGAAAAIDWWNKARVNGDLVVLPGLERRRTSEKALFLTPEVPLAPQPTVTPLAENTRLLPSTEASGRRERISESRTIQGAGVAGVAGTAVAVAGAVEKSVDDPEKLGPQMQRVFQLVDAIPDWAYLALGALVLITSLYIINARIDDWRRHRR